MMHFVPVTRQTAGGRFMLSALAEACEAKGYALYAERVHAYVGYVEFAPGKRAFFKGACLDVNPFGAATLAVDKDYTARMLEEAGLAVPEGVLLFAPRFKAELAIKNPAAAAGLGFADAAHAFAGRYGFPLFLKPNEGSGGRGVHRVHSVEELFAAAFSLFEHEPTILLQKPAEGRDYRLLVLDGEMVAAYGRSALEITGDGVSSIGALTAQRLAEITAQGRPAAIRADDPRIDTELALQGLSRATVPLPGSCIRLMPNANLSTGGSAEDVSDRVHPDFAVIAIRAADALGLCFAGIDILTDDIAAAPSDYAVLEVNSAPGINNFAALSPEANRKARKVYSALVEKMRKNLGC